MPSELAVTTKALNAFLTSQKTSLSIAYARIGITDYADLLQHEMVSDANVGRIARLMGLTPERLAKLARASE